VIRKIQLGSESRAAFASTGVTMVRVYG